MVHTYINNHTYLFLHLPTPIPTPTPFPFPFPFPTAHPTSKPRASCILWVYFSSPVATEGPTSTPWRNYCTPPICYRYVTSHHITSHRIASHRIASHHITSHHITSHHINKIHYILLFFSFTHHPTTQTHTQTNARPILQAKPDEGLGAGGVPFIARDSFTPIASRSALADLLPPALITILHSYGPQRFAAVFTGHVDSPEAIWSPELRLHLCRSLDAHLCGFMSRLRQHTTARYRYCPLPRIAYPGLDTDTEVFVNIYYLRHLCQDYERAAWAGFGAGPWAGTGAGTGAGAGNEGWPIQQPLAFLRDLLERWRVEMAKGAVTDVAAAEAAAVLGLGLGAGTGTGTGTGGGGGTGGGTWGGGAIRVPELSELRYAYKALARRYHPDRNPSGRDMFEKVQAAYELLSAIAGQLVSIYILYMELLFILYTYMELLCIVLFATVVLCSPYLLIFFYR